MEGRETLYCGWPVAINKDYVSPILYSELTLTPDGDQPVVHIASSGSNINPFACKCLRIEKEEWESIVHEIETSIEVEETANESEFIAVLVKRLQQKLEDESLNGVDHNALCELSNEYGIHNTGIIATTRGMNLQYNKHLIPELKQLAKQPELLLDGPAGTLLGFTKPSKAEGITPHPTVSFSSLRQDEAVASAMSNNFTVVSGPPGTGKSQILLNIVAASIAKNESVLLASKNNQPIDVVCDRLKSCCPAASVVRVRSNLNIPNPTQPPTHPIRKAESTVHEEWCRVDLLLRQIYTESAKRNRLERDLSRKRSEHNEVLSVIPSNVQTNVDPDELKPAIDTTVHLLDRISKPLRFLFKKKRFLKRRDRVRSALDTVYKLMYATPECLEDVYRALDSVPMPLKKPRELFQKTVEIANHVLRLMDISSTIKSLEKNLGQCCAEALLEDRLFTLNQKRIAIGREYVAWQLRQRLLSMEENGQTHAAVQHVVKVFNQYSQGGNQRNRIEKHFDSALSVLPAWAVTMQSLASKVPFIQQVFDLVVIDEASQCDIASVLPLLVRAKRALIIGDQQQLPHITTISSSREKHLAEKNGLKCAELEDYSYTRLSCYDLASLSVAKAIFLNLHFRSNPSIILFSDKQFYDDKLELCSEERPVEGYPAIEWKNVEGKCEYDNRKSRFNEEEAQIVVQHALSEVHRTKGLGIDFGIITPYHAQKDLLSKILKNTADDSIFESIKIGTVHSFQGDERDVIYFSSVIDAMSVNRTGRFFSTNLVNVAVTRARNRLVMFGNQAACLSLENSLSLLVKYVVEQDARFDSPLERDLFNALMRKGIPTMVNVALKEHKLDLAIQLNGISLNVECDGAAFHSDSSKDRKRDREIKSLGWDVLRFSYRELNRDLGSCVDKVITRLG